ncbi:hypothetical protein ACSRUE_02635 [Sorangium sp. KYC3313]|uniref:hypothetical protein n=1 Tax=Sorangium sp. KYC3313 TaxID=3449740 RepID=UPI003F8B2F81
MMDKRCFAFKQNHDRAARDERCGRPMMWSLGLGYGYVAAHRQDRRFVDDGHEASAPLHTIAPRSWNAEDRA